ncbi:MAG: hypothetical protein ABL876_04445 [Chitinophagaceae bacterium]
MKKWLTIAGMLAFSASYSQNEFAATTFYNEFRKISTDAQNGFVLNKGAKKNAEYEEVTDEYAAKLHLSLADSGKIVYPVNGIPYAIYFFEPSKNRLKVDQRGLNLREAVGTAYGKLLYVRTETNVIRDKIFSTTLFYDTPETDDKKKALFKLSIYYLNGLYHLSFEIKGKPAGA